MQHDGSRGDYPAGRDAPLLSPLYDSARVSVRRYEYLEGSRCRGAHLTIEGDVVVPRLLFVSLRLKVNGPNFPAQSGAHTIPSEIPDSIAAWAAALCAASCVERYAMRSCMRRADFRLHCVRTTAEMDRALAYEQTPFVVIFNQERPVESSVTTRSWLPTLGVARHTVSVAGATPTPIG